MIESRASGQQRGARATGEAQLPLREIAATFKILADPTRLRLLQAMTLECKSVTQLTHEVSLPQPLVSHHLRILRDARLARQERRGAYVYY